MNPRGIENDPIFIEPDRYFKPPMRVEYFRPLQAMAAFAIAATLTTAACNAKVEATSPPVPVSPAITLTATPDASPVPDLTATYETKETKQAVLYKEIGEIQLKWEKYPGIPPQGTADRDAFITDTRRIVDLTENLIEISYPNQEKSFSQNSVIVFSIEELNTDLQANGFTDYDITVSLNGGLTFVKPDGTTSRTYFLFLNKEHMISFNSSGISAMDIAIAIAVHEALHFYNPIVELTNDEQIEVLVEGFVQPVKMTTVDGVKLIGTTEQGQKVYRLANLNEALTEQGTIEMLDTGGIETGVENQYYNKLLERLRLMLNTFIKIKGSDPIHEVGVEELLSRWVDARNTSDIDTIFNDLYAMAPENDLTETEKRQWATYILEYIFAQDQSYLQLALDLMTDPTKVRNITLPEATSMTALPEFEDVITTVWIDPYTGSWATVYEPMILRGQLAGKISFVGV